MRITRKDLPEPIAEEYEAQLKESGTVSLPTGSQVFVMPAESVLDHNASEPDMRRQNARRVVLESQNLSLMERVGVSALVVLDFAALLGIMVGWSELGGLFALIVLLVTIVLNAGFIVWCKREEQRRRYHPRILRAVLPLVAKSPVEVMYVGALLRLVEQESLLGDSVSRGLLTQMNALLKSSGEISQQQEGIRASISDQSLAEIEAMRDDLTARVEQSKDSQARETLRQTLLLCESRLARAVALAPLKERLEAQQEMIRQTLASVGESLAGLRIAPQAVREPQLETVRETLEQIQRQTRSIEQAVQEVMALRAF